MKTFLDPTIVYTQEEWDNLLGTANPLLLDYFEAMMLMHILPSFSIQNSKEKYGEEVTGSLQIIIDRLKSRDFIIEHKHDNDTVYELTPSVKDIVNNKYDLNVLNKIHEKFLMSVIIYHT